MSDTDSSDFHFADEVDVPTIGFAAPGETSDADIVIRVPQEGKFDKEQVRRDVTDMILRMADPHSSYIHVDLADIMTLLGASVQMITFDKPDDIPDKIKAANLTACEAAIVSITGPESLSLQEGNAILERIRQQIDDGATIIWGLTLDDEYTNPYPQTLALFAIPDQKR